MWAMCAIVMPGERFDVKQFKPMPTPERLLLAFSTILYSLWRRGEGFGRQGGCIREHERFLRC